MGRKRGCTVEIRENSIRLKFVLDSGETVRETLMGDKEPLVPSPANIKYANRLATEIAVKLNVGAFNYAATFPKSKNASSAAANSVSAQLDTWLATLRVEDSTLAGYSSAVKFWKAAPFDAKGSLIGDVKLADLKLSTIKKAIALKPELSGKTINNYVSALREAIQVAVDDELLAINPAADKSLRAKHQKEPPDPFSIEEAEKIIAHARRFYPEPVASMMEFWFYTGLRTSELAGLRWGSIDWNMKQAQIHEAVVRGKAKATTKTAVVRNLNLNSRALAAITRQKAHTFLRGEYVWLDPRYNTPWNEERAFRRSYWTPALKACGIRYRRPYNARHTFATMLLMSGATPAYAAKQMGHSVEQFLNTYAKWLDDGHADIEQSRLESFIGVVGKVPESSPETKTGT